METLVIASRLPCGSGQNFRNRSGQNYRNPQLDGIGLAAVWRRALLARAVLRGRTKAYRNHPQLTRFRAHPSPVSAINAYLRAIHDEAAVRGYRFDKGKLGPVRNKTRIRATDGQLAYEWRHLCRKLGERDAAPEKGAKPVAHPLFRIVRGSVEEWERTA